MTYNNVEDFKRECQRRRDAGFAVRGETYPIKDRLRDLGGIWDSWAQAWLMPDAAAFAEGTRLATEQALARAAQAVNGAPPPPARPVARGRRGFRRPRPAAPPAAAPSAAPPRTAPTHFIVRDEEPIAPPRAALAGPQGDIKAPPRRRFGRLAGDDQ